MSYGFHSTAFAYNLGCKHCLGEYEHTPQQHEQAILEDAASIKAMTAGPRLRDTMQRYLPLIRRQCADLGTVVQTHPHRREQYESWLFCLLDFEAALQAAGTEWDEPKQKADVVQMVPKGGVQ
jgi:hypothetical protein